LWIKLPVLSCVMPAQHVTDCLVFRCRCVIPDKLELERGLTELMSQKFPDSKGLDIITQATWEAHERALKIVQEGRVSGACCCLHLPWLTDSCE